MAVNCSGSSIGATFAGAFAKAQLAAGGPPPQGGTALLSVRDVDKPGVVGVARDLAELGFSLVATGGTATVLEQAGLQVRRVNKVLEGRPHIVDMIKNDEADIIVNTTEGRRWHLGRSGPWETCEDTRATGSTAPRPVGAP